MKEEKSPLISYKIQKGVLAGLISTIIVHPLDVVKVRQQLTHFRFTSAGIASRLLKSEGWKVFYCGVTAGMVRQVLNTTTRLALYDILYQRYCKLNKKKPELADHVAIGIGASMVGAFLGNPSEVELVRKLAVGCSHSPPLNWYSCRCQRAYMSPNTTKGIICEEGLRGLWRGTLLTMLRSAIISTVHIGAFFQIRDYLKEKEVAKDNYTLSIYTAIVTSLISAFLSHPVDIVKTFFQVSNLNYVTHRGIFRNLVCARGFTGLYKGFTPYFMRMALHALITFTVLEYWDDTKDNKKK